MRLILNILGFLFVGLGFLGIFLPLLPTTPFLLLASWLFFRSSKKFHNWLLNHKIFGKFINDYITYKAIPLKSKIIAIILIWSTLPISVILFIPLLSIQILLFSVGIIVTFKISKISTLKKVKEKIINDI